MIDKIIQKYLTEESVVQYWKKIPTRARLMIWPIVKLQTVSGQDWDEIKNKCNKEMSLKISASEMEKLFKELEKVKFVSIKESPQLVVVAITDFGKKKAAEHREHLAIQMKKPPTPIKWSEYDKKQLEKIYNGKSGNWTGD